MIKWLSNNNLTILALDLIRQRDVRVVRRQIVYLAVKCNYVKETQIQNIQITHKPAPFIAMLFAGRPTLQIINFSNIKRSSIEDFESVDSRCKKRKPVIFMPEIHFPQKFQQPTDIGLCFENCALVSLDNISEILPSILFYPEKLTYLDLRNNHIENLKFIHQLPNIKILYLQNNNISKLDQLKPLDELSQLKCLTLNGNPIMTLPNMFERLLTMYPNLRSLNLKHITDHTRFFANKLITELEDKKYREEKARLKKQQQEQKEQTISEQKEDVINEALCASQRLANSKPYNKLIQPSPTMKIKKNYSFSQIPLEYIYNFNQDTVKTRIYDGIKTIEWYQDDDTLKNLLKIFNLKQYKSDIKHIQKNVMIITMMDYLLKNFNNLSEDQQNLVNNIIQTIYYKKPIQGKNEGEETQHIDVQKLKRFMHVILERGIVTDKQYTRAAKLITWYLTEQQNNMSDMLSNAFLTTSQLVQAK